MLDQAAVLERRRQILRVILVVIIFATMPLYCLGFFLLATAPEGKPQEQVLPTATVTSIGGSQLVTATNMPTLSLTLGTIPTLQPTPFQYIPPIVNPPTATIIIIIPTSTFAPTLTFPPSITPFPTQENTPIPPPTNTLAPLPTNTDVPPPANTEIPLPTTPPDVILPPTDTPTPTASL